MILDYNTFQNSPKIKIPDGVKLEAKFSLVEPLACCINAFSTVSSNNKKCVLIFGFGPMGYLLGKLSLIKGYEKVIYFEKNSFRVKYLKKIKRKKIFHLF